MYENKQIRAVLDIEFSFTGVLKSGIIIKEIIKGTEGSEMLLTDKDEYSMKHKMLKYCRNNSYNSIQSIEVTDGKQFVKHTLEEFEDGDLKCFIFGRHEEFYYPFINDNHLTSVRHIFKMCIEQEVLDSIKDELNKEVLPVIERSFSEGIKDSFIRLNNSIIRPSSYSFINIEPRCELVEVTLAETN